MNHPDQKKDPRKVEGGRKGGKMRRSKNREVVKLERMKLVMERRLEGVPFDTIGRELNLSQQRAWQIYDEAMEAAREKNDKLAERVRTIGLLRMDRMAGKGYKLYMASALSVKTTAEDGDVMELRDFEILAKLGPVVTQMTARLAALAGADAPKPVAVTGTKALSDAELVARLKAHGIDPETM